MHIGLTARRLWKVVPLILSGSNSFGGLAFCGNLSEGSSEPTGYGWFGRNLWYPSTRLLTKGARLLEDPCPLTLISPLMATMFAVSANVLVCGWRDLAFTARIYTFVVDTAPPPR